MVGADGHPAGISGQVIDAVRHRLARAVPGEVMGPGRHRLALGPPFPARVLELTDQLLLLGVHADHRIRGALMGLDLLVDVPELRIAVRVPLALDGLGVALQAEPLGPQQVTNGVGADPVTLAGQLRRQVAGQLGRPPQRRHRITALLRLHQGQQRRAQPRIQIGGLLAAAARPAHPAQRLHPGIQLTGSQRHRGLADPGGLGHHPDPAMPQRPGLGPHQQPPLPLIQMRKDHLKLRRQHLPGFLHSAHTTPMCQISGSYGLFFCKLLLPAGRRDPARRAGRPPRAAAPEHRHRRGDRAARRRRRPGDAPNRCVLPAAAPQPACSRRRLRAAVLIWHRLSARVQLPDNREPGRRGAAAFAQVASRHSGRCCPIRKLSGNNPGGCDGNLIAECDCAREFRLRLIRLIRRGYGVSAG